MEDRFKFRVYFKGSKYAEAGYQDLSRKDVIFSLKSNGQIIRTVVYECQQEGHENSPCFMPFEPDNDLYDIQFCTGLKDRNGKLIYEGDIVKIFHVSSTMQPSEFIGVVSYDNKKGHWGIERNGRIDCFFEDYIYEVIGNIYENKELLDESI